MDGVGTTATVIINALAAAPYPHGTASCSWVLPTLGVLEFMSVPTPAPINVMTTSPFPPWVAACSRV